VGQLRFTLALAMTYKLLMAALCTDSNTGVELHSLMAPYAPFMLTLKLFAVVVGIESVAVSRVPAALVEVNVTDTWQLVTVVNVLPLQESPWILKSPGLDPPEIPAVPNMTGLETEAYTETTTGDAELVGGVVPVGTPKESAEGEPEMEGIA